MFPWNEKAEELMKYFIGLSGIKLKRKKVFIFMSSPMGTGRSWVYQKFMEARRNHENHSTFS